MSISSLRVAGPLWRAPRIGCLIALGIAATACGGGVDAAADAAPAPSAGPTPALASASAERRSAAATRSVEIEGCVLDGHYIPTTGTPVRALSADGRLLANALSDVDGRFRMRLPAPAVVTLQIDRAHGESLQVRVDGTPSAGLNCLLDTQA